MGGVPPDADTIAAVLEPVLARFPEVAAAYLFGSAARGDAGPDSDLDIGVVYARDGRSPDTVAPLLAQAIGKASGFEIVDVVDLGAQGSMFCLEVLTTGRRLCERDRERRVDFESNVMARAYDFRPTYLLATQGKARALRAWLKERDDLRPDPVSTRRAQGQPREAG